MVSEYVQSLVGIVEMSQIVPQLHSRTFYHGTKDERKGIEILHRGLSYVPVVDGGRVRGRANLDPVVGRVYVSPYVSYALIYALGYNGAGREIPPSVVEHDGRYGYVFGFSGESLGDVQPDEDNVGGIVYAFAHLHEKEKLTGSGEDNYLPNLVNDVAFLERMNKLALSVATAQQYAKAAYGYYQYYAAVGKKMLRRMSDSDKLRFIELGAHVSSGTTLVPEHAWKVDKLRCPEFKPDGSNFFEVAEEIPMS